MSTVHNVSLRIGNLEKGKNWAGIFRLLLIKFATAYPGVTWKIIPHESAKMLEFEVTLSGTQSKSAAEVIASKLHGIELEGRKLSASLVTIGDLAAPVDTPKIDPAALADLERLRREVVAKRAAVEGKRKIREAREELKELKIRRELALERKKELQELEELRRQKNRQRRIIEIKLKAAAEVKRLEEALERKKMEKEEKGYAKKLKEKEAELAELKRLAEDMKAENEALDAKLDKRELNWAQTATERWTAWESAKLVSFRIDGGYNIGKLVVNSEDSVQFRMGQMPTDRGSIRFAFWAQMQGRSGRYYAKRPFCEDRCLDLSAFTEDLRMSLIAIDLSKSFNSKATGKKITFVEPMLIKLNRGGKDYYMSLEPRIEGAWEKFTNNTTGESAKQKTSVTAFCHFTWAFTNRKLMVCDLQGVKDDSRNQYTLTDPALHSASSSFGRTDFGDKGFDMFFGKHRCSPVCVHLKLNQGDARHPGQPAELDSSVTT